MRIKDFAMVEAKNEFDVLDLEGSMDSLECQGGGKGGSTPTPVYTAPAVAPAATEAATQEEAVTPEEEEARKKEALTKGAKSLQIPVTGDTGADTGTVGTATSATQA
jgi:hypothetical protein